MLKKFSFVLCASVFFISPSVAGASDKVLSPISPWEIYRQDNAVRHCDLSANYENDIKLSFSASNGQVEAITITDNSASFVPNQNLEANLSFLPPYSISANAITKNNNSYSVDVASSQGLIQKLGASFIVKVQLNEIDYSFSLTDLKNSLRNLQTCRNAANEKPIGLISFDDENTSSDVVLSENANSIAAYPIGGEPQPKKEQSVANFTAPTKGIQPIAPDEVLENNAPVDDTQILERQAPADTEDHNRTVTRIHQPASKIRPDLYEEQILEVEGIEEPDNSELRSPVIPDVADTNGNTPVSLAQAEDLSKPPEFDVSSIPIPEETDTSDVPVQRLASINDEQAEIYWNGKEIEGDIKPVMSQSASQAQKRPVVIPRIETADNPRRIDITNQEISRSTRIVSNQELENELKSAHAGDFDTSYEEPAIVNEVMPIGQTQQDASIDTQEYEMVTAAAPVAVQDEFLVNEPQAKWTAKAGDNLKEVIANWSVQENVELVWDTTEKYSVLNNLVHNDSYEKAIAGLLNQYTLQKQSSRPVGQLYIDPDTGEKMLIVQSN